MKKCNPLATMIAGLTVLTASLLAQTPSAPASNKMPSSTPAPGSAPALQPISPPPAPMTPINPATPEAPRIYASPVVPVDTTATPAAINPSATPATMTPNASVGMSSGTYSSMDSDGDGKVSAAEYSRYQSRTSAAATSPTENTPPAEKRGFWSRMFHGEDKSVKTGAAGRSNPTFIDLDTNHDGYLSQTELDAGSSLKK